MSPAEIVERAAADGVCLTLSMAGTIIATGDNSAVYRWLPAIRGHKPAIILALRKEVDEATSWRRLLPITPALPVTPPNVTPNENVACSTNSDVACDGVTANSRNEDSLPMTLNQKIVLSEFHAMIVQERLNCFINNQAWPKGSSLDYVADQLKGKIVRVDYRLRRSITGVILRQLVQMGTLAQHGDLLTLPDY